MSPILYKIWDKFVTQISFTPTCHLKHYSWLVQAPKQYKLNIPKNILNTTSDLSTILESNHRIVRHKIARANKQR